MLKLKTSVVVAINCQAVLSALSVYPAVGRTSEGQARRRLVPFVRVYTDCIASNIRSKPVAFQQARSGNWNSAVSSTLDACRDSGLRMVFAHEQIYGSGTGMAFLKGPYLQDLPRALQARLQPDFDQLQNEESQQIETDTREKLASAERKKLFEGLVDEHVKCMAKLVYQIVPFSREGAETIADVIVHKCEDITEKRISLGIASLRLTRAEAEKVVREDVAKARQEIISLIVTARANESMGQGGNQVPPNTAGPETLKAQPL